MKRLLFLFFLCVFSAGCMMSQPKLRLIRKVITLDTVSYSQKEIRCKVPFTNIGDSPLYLVRAKVFCPCMKVEHSDEAVLPGDTSSVDVIYRFNHAYDYSNPVWLFYNTENPEEFEQFTLYGFIKDE